jgi:hypothetical protein
MKLLFLRACQNELRAYPCARLRYLSKVYGTNVTTIDRESLVFWIHHLAEFVKKAGNGETYCRNHIIVKPRL